MWIKPSHDIDHRLDCPQSGLVQVQAFFSCTQTCTRGSVQLVAEPEPTGSGSLDSGLGAHSSNLVQCHQTSQIWQDTISTLFVPVVQWPHALWNPPYLFTTNNKKVNAYMHGQCGQIEVTITQTMTQMTTHVASRSARCRVDRWMWLSIKCALICVYQGAHLLFFLHVTKLIINYDHNLQCPLQPHLHPHHGLCH